MALIGYRTFVPNVASVYGLCTHKSPFGFL